MSILVWAAIMIVFVVAVVFVKKLPVQYALMVGPFIIALLMGYSVPETVDFFLAQFNGTMKSAGLMIVFSILYFGLLTETGFFSTVGNAVFRLTKGKMNIYAVMAMTVILTAIGMLTATIGTAYLVVFPLMLPFYERMKFDKKAALVIVTCTAAAMCFLPWGIGMAINASFANVDVMELCSKVIPITVVFIPVIVLEVIYFGIRHKKQGGIMKMELNAEELDALCNAGSDAPTRRPKMFVPNAIVFLASMAMGGSFSIKSVLPAIFPDDPALDYHNLEGVHNGSEAMSIFPKMKDMPPEEQAKARHDLLKYCELDTFAMVKVWQALCEAAE